MGPGLRMGMFVGGIIMALVPFSLGVGMWIFFLRRYLEEREGSPPLGDEE